MTLQIELFYYYSKGLPGDSASWLLKAFAGKYDVPSTLKIHAVLHREELRLTAGDWQALHKLVKNMSSDVHLILPPCQGQWEMRQDGVQEAIDALAALPNFQLRFDDGDLVR